MASIDPTQRGNREDQVPPSQRRQAQETPREQDQDPGAGDAADDRRDSRSADGGGGDPRPQSDAGAQGGQPEGEGAADSADESVPVSVRLDKDAATKTSTAPTAQDIVADIAANAERKLSDEMVTRMREAGMSDDVIEMSRQAAATSVDQRNRAIAAEAGGGKNWEKIQQWAAKNLNDAALDHYNAGLDNVDEGVARQTARDLAAAYFQATGKAYKNHATGQNGRAPQDTNTQPPITDVDDYHKRVKDRRYNNPSEEGQRYTREVNQRRREFMAGRAHGVRVSRSATKQMPR